MFDVEKIRLDFPLLSQQVNGQPLVYLDSAATSQKPHCVINATSAFYQNENANVHRGRHSLSEQATHAYEQGRITIAHFFAVHANELVWTKGATESINLIAHGLQSRIKKGDKIAISLLEHHANIVPWQQLAQLTGAEIIALPLTLDNRLDAHACCEFINTWQPKIVAITHASNALGNITDIAPILNTCRQISAISVVDGAQAAMHLRPNLSNLGCDFYVFSAHKMLGPTGLGGLYGRHELLNSLSVYQTGGEMIEHVSLTHSTFRPAPAKFEAGTPNIAAVIAFTQAIKYLQLLDVNAVSDYEKRLFNYAVKRLSSIDGITILSDCEHNIGNLSFNYRDEHPYDLATLLDSYGVAVRSGHHCAQPLMSELNVVGTIRASFAFYNTQQDVDRFIDALIASIELLD
ncbi:SufS family cysteine desulfurase [Pseudoalteromonas mariniglutinosa]|uniref:SufS family cysteine desulfurase n=1 Tax=Pseudoalteromonas mariniglutinosa TaxID=206042 RepID=UPI00384ECAF4